MRSSKNENLRLFNIPFFCGNMARNGRIDYKETILPRRYGCSTRIKTLVVFVIIHISSIAKEIIFKMFQKKTFSGNGSILKSQFAIRMHPVFKGMKFLCGWFGLPLMCASIVFMVSFFPLYFVFLCQKYDHLIDKFFLEI